MALLLSGGILNECTQRSFSLFTSAIRLDIETRMKYLCLGVRNAVCQDAKQCSPEFDINALVTFVLFLYVLEHEIKGLCLPQIPWCGEFLREGQKFMMVSSVIEQFYGSR